MIYPSVISAVVRALAAEVMSDVAQCWRDPDAIGAARRAGEIVGKDEARLYDVMVHALLHDVLTPEQWDALTAKYSTDIDRKRGAIKALRLRVQTPAPDRFRDAAVLTWALPKLPGRDGKRSTSVLPEAWYCMDRWSDEPVPVKTQERWRRDIRKSLEQKVDDALAAAQEVLDAEGLIRTEAA